MEQPHDDAIAALSRASLDHAVKIAALEHGDKFASVASLDRCAARVDDLDAATLDHSRKIAALEQAHGIASVKFGAMAERIEALEQAITDRLTRLGGVLTERVEALEDRLDADARRTTTVTVSLR